MEKHHSDPQDWVESYGRYLYRFALARVRDQDVAEELVQETLIAALEARDRFAGQSSERSWMVGILKHKMIDYFRKAAREPVHATFDGEDDGAQVDQTFLADGHWKPGSTAPSGWPESADALIDRRQFWETLKRCLEALPSRTAQVFTLRELDELEADEICRMLQLSSSNLWVILHRARRQLRECLDVHYLGREQVES